MQNKIKIIKENKCIKVYVYEDDNLVEEYSESENSKRLEGNIYLGKVKEVIDEMQSAFIDIGTSKKALIHLDDLENEDLRNIKTEKISDILKPESSILIQIKKDAIGSKGAKATRNIKLVGKYVILMPFSNIITISKKIISEEQKERILNVINNYKEKSNFEEKTDNDNNLENEADTYFYEDNKEKNKLKNQFGIIARTLAEKATNTQIENDIKMLEKRWNDIIEKSKNAVAPELIYDNKGIIGKLITDFDLDNVEIITNDENILNQSKLENEKIKITLDKDLNFEENKKRKVWLKCGGFITIDQTEALVAIDVNSGKYRGKDNFETSILKVNTEAAIQIAKEIRLRDLGGIIIIDFIDMKTNEEREEVKKVMENEVKKDRARVQVFEFTKLGLLELTRKSIYVK